MDYVDQRLIPSFVVVAEVGNVTRAATQLNLSQPALSAQLKRLERQVGAPLFNRTTAGVTLTSAGEAFLRRAREIVSLSLLAVHEARAMGGDTLRIDVHDEVLAVPRIALDRLQRDRTRMEISAIAVPMQDVQLMNGRLDLALAGAREELPAAMMQQTIAVEPLGVALSATHPLAHQDTLDLRQLADDPFYLPRREFSPDWAAMVERLSRDSGFEPRIAPFTTESARLPMTLVGRGDCVAVSLLSTPVPSTVRVLPLAGDHDFEWTVRFRRDARESVHQAAAQMAEVAV